MIQEIYTIWYREIKKLLRNKIKIFISLIFPLAILIIFGYGFGSAFSIPNLNVNYNQFLSIGILGMVLLMYSLSSGISVLQDKTFGFMKEILVAPISRSSIVIGKILGGATVTLFHTLLLLIVMLSLNLISISCSNFLIILIFMLLISFTFLGLGLIIASFISESETFHILMQIVMIPLFFLSGMFFPTNNLPIWLKIPSYINPLTYGIDGLRGVILSVSEKPILYNLEISFIFCIFIVFIGVYVFNKKM